MINKTKNWVEHLDELEALFDRATPGPWKADIDDPQDEDLMMWTGKFYTDGGEGTWCTYGQGTADGPRMTPKQDAINAMCCAAAREAVPQLIKALREKK